MKTLSIQLLGTVDIRLGEQPVTGFVSNKAQALLLYLAVTQRPITRTALATLLWGDWGETAARRSLSKALSNLRQLVGDHLKIERHTVVFQAERAHWLDVATFEEILDSTEFAQPDGEMADRAVEALQKAVALYQGEFLAGFYVDNAPDFEVWARAERERLYHLYYKALIRLINLTERAADLSQAIGYTQQLLHLEPTDEDAHRRLMALYMRNGQRSRALAQYKVCREILANELNVEPAAETSSLYRAIRQGDTAPHHTTFATAIDESATAISSLPPQQTNTAHLLPSMHPRPEFPLIGRTAHWQHLLTIWQQTRTGRPHVCLIRGEAGIGKTRLAEELLQWVAKRGGAVARTRAYGAAGELAYAPIIDWLRSATLQTALATLDPIWLTEMVTVTERSSVATAATL
jgi:DNA-binding SARP family transcriptional activator